MVSAHEEGQVGCGAGAGVVFVEVADHTVFGRHGHCEEVVAVADCLMRSASVRIQCFYGFTCTRRYILGFYGRFPKVGKPRDKYISLHFDWGSKAMVWDGREERT